MAEHFNEELTQAPAGLAKGAPPIDLTSLPPLKPLQALDFVHDLQVSAGNFVHAACTGARAGSHR